MPNDPCADPLIQCTDMSVGHGTLPVLSKVNWTVHRGQTWSVIGRNGVGKSTLLATVLGRLPPLCGHLRRLPGLVTGSVPQQCGLVTNLPVTVREFVELGLFAIPRKQRQSLVNAALMTCDISALASCQVWQVSGGERQRAMIARALATRPSLLALDEPCAGLDAVAESELMEVLRRLSADGVAVIYITHDIHLAATQSSHVAVIDQGTLREIEPQKLLGAWSGIGSELRKNDE